MRLIDNTIYHFRDAQIVLSLGTPRDDNPLFNERVIIVNNVLKSEYKYDTQVKLVHHQNLLHNGMIIDNLYKHDRYHLNKDGTRVLAANLRYAVERNYALKKYAHLNNHQLICHLLS